MRMIELKAAMKAIPRGITLNQLKCTYIEHILEVCEGNRTKAASELGVNYANFRVFLNESSLDVPPPTRGRPKIHQELENS